MSLVTVQKSAKRGEVPASRARSAAGVPRVASSERAAPEKKAPSQKKLTTKGQKRSRSRGTEGIPRPLRSRKCLESLQAIQARTLLQSLRCVVITLDRRPDRMDGCSQRLTIACPDLRFERFSATDGKVTEIPLTEVSTSWHTARNVIYQKQRAVRKGWNDLDTYQERQLALSPGERGCSSSHIRAWRHCLALAGNTDTPLMVLEDDAAPTPEFTGHLARAFAALPSDCGLLYLGYSQAAEWRCEVSPNLAESTYVWTTVGYIIWPACARTLLSRLPVNEPVDNWMAGISAAGDVKAYCVRPKIVLQADAWNVNSDVAHSDEHYWGPCSDIQHSDEFYWGPDDPRGRHDGGHIAGTGLLFGSDSSDSEDFGDEA